MRIRDSLRKVLAGFAAIGNPFSVSDKFIVPQKGDQAQDLRNLSSDMQRVMSSLGANIQKETRKRQ
jgi:hypothetical protein